MSGSKQPTFLVSAYSEPIVIRIHGKANHLNCKNFREFMEKMVGDRKHRFALDFEHCTGMDSTFLGILAGTALELRRQDPPGVLLICNLNERNRELICNLGLQSLLSIDAEVSAPEEAVVARHWTMRKSPVRAKCSLRTKASSKPIRRMPRPFRTSLHFCKISSGPTTKHLPARPQPPNLKVI